MKPRIILLHGALGSKETLNRLSDQLSEQFNVYSFDFIGHGNQTENKPFQVPDLVEQLHQEVQQFKNEEVLIFGFSMGGYIALQYAIQHQSSIAGIITLGTKLTWSSEIAQAEIKQLNPDKIELKVPKFAQYLDGLHNDWKKIVLNTSEMMLALGKQHAFSLHELNSIIIPVAIILGDKDNMVSESESKIAVSHLPNGRFHSLDNTPHPIEQVEIKRISDSIIQFSNLCF